jgi:dTDP-4-dehydrorhamnose reductase
MSKLRIIIFGGTGNVGTNLTAHLKNKGMLIVAPLRNEVTAPSNTEKLVDYFRMQAPDVVVNCAAMIGLDQCETMQEAATEVNTLFPQRLSYACEELDIRLIQISTENVYACHDFDEPHFEDSPTHPTTHYGLSKLLGEEPVRAYKNGLVLRLPLVFSSDLTNSRLIVNRLVNEIISGKTVRVASDVYNTPMVLTSVVDKVCELILDSHQHDTNLVNLCSNKVVSLSSLIYDIAEALRIPNAIEPVESKFFNSPVEKPRFGGLKSKFIEPLSYEYMISNFLSERIHL